MPQIGIPLENQWARWPGLTYQLPVQCWVGPHHSAVITGIARAGINALIELAGGKQPRGRPAGLLCCSPRVQDAVGWPDAILNAGRAYRSAMITELWNTLASGKRDDARTARPLPLGRGLRRRQRAPGDGFNVPARRQHVVQARQPPRRMLARPAHRRADRHARARVVPDRRPRLSRHGPGPALALAVLNPSNPHGRSNRERR
jgi:hypothetical protein